MSRRRDRAVEDDDRDVVDFDELATEPGFAEAMADAEARAALRLTLIQARKACGLTQKDVAGAMETTQSAVSDFERGGTDPHLSTLQRYARAVGARLVVRAQLPGGRSDGWLGDVQRSGYQGRTLRTRAAG